MSGLYFNEIDPFAGQWLKNLFPGAEVDQRSIADVRGADLVRFTRCHFFGGIGGWEWALRLAGWPSDRPVWTGSCPCQPFSSAGQQKGEADARHLWPEFRRLIAIGRPATIFGEQVAGSLGREWLARVRADLEALGYAVGAADLCAPSVGAPDIRQRLWWVAYANVAQLPPVASTRQQSIDEQTAGTGRMADPESCDGRREFETRGTQSGRAGFAGSGSARGVCDPASRGLGIDGSASGHSGHADESSAAGGMADSFDSRSQGRVRGGGA